MRTFHKRHHRTVMIISGFILILFSYNNCSKYASNLDQSSTDLSAKSDPQDPSAEVIPPKPNLILTCINKSTSTASKFQKMSVAEKSQKISMKIRDFSWDKSEDLIVTLASRCLTENQMTDSLLQYIAEEDLRLDIEKFVYVIHKESVTDLQQFNLDAMSSVCLEAADINKKMKLFATDPQFVNQTFYNSINMTTSFLTKLLSYNGGNLYTSKVAVVDSGIDTNHPDLTAQIARNSSGQVIGINAANGSTDYSDHGFHGTHVTGLIAASYDNGSHGTGTYGKNIKIYPARVFDTEDSAPMNVIANAILWAGNQGVDLINISMGGSTSADPVVLRNAVQTTVDKGVFIIVAAGNDGRSLDTASLKTYPAVYSKDIDGLITVGSFDSSSRALSSFSNYSPQFVDILSPGSNGSSGIISTVPIALAPAGLGSKIGGSPIHGTSMATPIVTGAIAAMVSMAKGKGYRITPSQLERFVRNEGSPTNSSYTSYSQAGKYLDYNHMYNALVNQMDSANKIINFQTQPKIQKVIVGDKVILTTSLTAESNYIVNYQWLKNNQVMNGETKANLTMNTVTTADAAEYQLEISSGTKKMLSQKVTVSVGLKYCD